MIEIEIDRDHLARIAQLQILRPLVAFAFVEHGMLERDRRLVGDRLQQAQIGAIEPPVALVENLDGADRRARVAAQGNAHHRPGVKAGALVDGGIEARIAIGVIDDRRALGREHRAGDARGGGDADLGDLAAERDPRIELAALGVMEKDGAALGVERGHRQLHQPAQQFVER
jgi:hypothetical protein